MTQEEWLKSKGFQWSTFGWRRGVLFVWLPGEEWEAWVNDCTADRLPCRVVANGVTPQDAICQCLVNYRDFIKTRIEKTFLEVLEE